MQHEQGGLKEVQLQDKPCALSDTKSCHTTENVPAVVG